MAIAPVGRPLPGAAHVAQRSKRNAGRKGTYAVTPTAQGRPSLCTPRRLGVRCATYDCDSSAEVEGVGFVSASAVCAGVVAPSLAAGAGNSCDAGATFTGPLGGRFAPTSGVISPVGCGRGPRSPAGPLGRGPPAPAGRGPRSPPGRGPPAPAGRGPRSPPGPPLRGPLGRGPRSPPGRGPPAPAGRG